MAINKKQTNFKLQVKQKYYKDTIDAGPESRHLAGLAQMSDNGKVSVDKTTDPHISRLLVCSPSLAL